MTVKERLFYILENKYMGDEYIVLSEETDLIEDLKLDSVDVFRVLADVEEAFQIHFDDANLLIEKFSRLGNFCALIEEAFVRGNG